MSAPRHHLQTSLRGLRILGFRQDPATASNNSVRSQYPSVRILYGDRFCFFLSQARGMNAGQFTRRERSLANPPLRLHRGQCRFVRAVRDVAAMQMQDQVRHIRRALIVNKTFRIYYVSSGGDKGNRARMRSSNWSRTRRYAAIRVSRLPSTILGSNVFQNSMSTAIVRVSSTALCCASGDKVMIKS